MRKALLYVVAVFTMALSFEASAQQRVVTGTVISEEDGLGLPGATVLVKGTTVGTTTDLDGNYSLELSRSATVHSPPHASHTPRTPAAAARTMAAGGGGAALTPRAREASVRWDDESSDS